MSRCGHRLHKRRSRWSPTHRSAHCPIAGGTRDCVPDQAGTGAPRGRSDRIAGPWLGRAWRTYRDREAPKESRTALPFLGHRAPADRTACLADHLPGATPAPQQRHPANDRRADAMGRARPHRRAPVLAGPCPNTVGANCSLTDETEKKARSLEPHQARWNHSDGAPLRHDQTHDSKGDAKSISGDTVERPGEKQNRFTMVGKRSRAESI